MIRNIFHPRQSHIHTCFHHLWGVQLRMCSQVSNNTFELTDLCSNQDDQFLLESHKFRNTLYPDTTDVILTELKSCNSMQQVFDIFIANQSNFKSQYLCQSVLTLRDMQKLFNKFYLSDLTHTTTQQRYDTEIDESNHSVFAEFQNALLDHEQFKELLAHINNQCDQFTIDETTCTILYLRYLGLGLGHDTVQRLIYHANKTFAATPSEEFDQITYQTLSRFFSSFKFEDSLYTLLTLSKTLPIVIRKLENCTDIYSLGQIAVCLEVVKELMSTDLRQLFRTRLDSILATLKVSSTEDTRSLVKIVLFLNETFWNEENGKTIQRLLLKFADCTPLLEVKEIMHIQKVFGSHLEPYAFLDQVQKKLELVTSRCEDFRGSEPSLATLACLAPVSNNKQKKFIEKVLLRKLKEPGTLLNTMTTLSTVSDLVRFLKMDNNQIHVLYWDRVLVLLQDQCNMAFLMYFTLRYIKRYLYKNNFRNLRFEEFVTRTLCAEIDYASPNNLAQYASVLLKFKPNYARSQIPDHLYERMLSNVHQFSLLNCFVLMDAMSSMILLSVPEPKKNLSSKFSVQLTKLERCLESRIHQILDESDRISIVECFEIFHKKKCKNWQHIYQRLYRKIPSENITSKLIYAACRSITFSESSEFSHALLKKCVEYCEANDDVIIGLVVSNVLYTCYLSSYPLHSRHPEFLEIAGRILVRDKDTLYAHLLIRSSLALAYYHYLPRSLVDFIFSLEFLEDLDEEIVARAPQNLSLKIRQDLMELNRAVCLDYAQFSIPWFHGKYVEQLLLTDQSSYSKFHSDVQNVLIHYVGDKTMVQANVMSPYGQKIDFLLYLDKLGNPIRSQDSVSTRTAQTRLAILLEQKWALGPNELRRRHLELQGYSVINLYRKDWNALFMGEPKAKHVFLDQIFTQYRPLITSGEDLF
uniref:FAST kinase domain-containing protein 1 n=1 Tax=Cacopsylla melanoneura TaxID=428564 RepID=A0A8D8SH57_9HEMI